MKEPLLETTEAEDQKPKFDAFPKKKKEFWRKEALDLRKCFVVLLPYHVLVLFLCDIYAYHFEVMSILADLGFIWLDYFNYMTLHKGYCMLEIFGMFVNSVVALSHVQRIILTYHEQSTLTKVCFFLQFFVFNIIALYVTLKRLLAHTEAQMEERKRQEL